MFHAVAYKTPSHYTAYKYAVTGGLKKFDHFRRGSLSSSLLILWYKTLYNYDV